MSPDEDLPSNQREREREREGKRRYQLVSSLGTFPSPLGPRNTVNKIIYIEGLIDW